MRSDSQILMLLSFIGNPLHFREWCGIWSNNTFQHFPGLLNHGFLLSIAKRLQFQHILVMASAQAEPALLGVLIFRVMYYLDTFADDAVMLLQHYSRKSGKLFRRLSLRVRYFLAVDDLRPFSFIHLFASESKHSHHRRSNRNSYHLYDFCDCPSSAAMRSTSSL